MENFLMKFCLYGLGIAGRLCSYFARYVYKRAGTDLFFWLELLPGLDFLNPSGQVGSSLVEPNGLNHSSHLPVTVVRLHDGDLHAVGWGEDP